MSRLEDVFEKEIKLYQKDIIEAYRELRKYKLLEAELGIDLITLFKALKENIYFDDCGKIIKVPVLGIIPMRENKFALDCYYNFKNFRVDTKDYGKTWSLDRNDLEGKDDE